MRSALMLASIFLGASAMACSGESAQTPPPPPKVAVPEGAEALKERVGSRFDEMAEKLALTAAQRTELEPVFADFSRRRVELMQTISGGGAELSRREKFKLARDLRALRDEQDAAMAKILTSDQMTTWNTLQEEQRSEMRARFQSRQGAETAPRE